MLPFPWLDLSDPAQLIGYIVGVIGILLFLREFGSLIYHARRPVSGRSFAGRGSNVPLVVFYRPTVEELGNMKLELVKHSADDIDVVNAARVSLAQHSEKVLEGATTGFIPEDAIKPHLELKWQLKPEDAGLIGFLMKNKHGTPFEHSTMTFRVKAPIAVFREWHRHRAGHSYNEMSGRYVKLRREFHYPTPRRQHGKPGAYTFTPDTRLRAKAVKPILWLAYNAGYAAYHGLTKLGVAKEVARFCLPVSTMSEMYWTCNSRSMMHFLALRNAPTAMQEIRVLAQAAEYEFAQIMPVTATKFVQNGRVAP